jgi:DNA topoisomerase VI subunit A
MSCTAKQTSLALCDAQEQGNSDSTLDDVACLLGCTRSSLHGETSFVYLA